MAQSRVSNNAEALVTTQRLAAVKESRGKCIILITVNSVFGCFSVAVAADGEGVVVQMQSWKQYGSVNNSTNVASELCSSVNFCSIKCVLVTKLLGQARN